MINSIYTHKEIFLREIISNASDAIDKLCYVALTDDKVGMNRSDFAITVSVDKENRTLTVSDNGIGMSAKSLKTTSASSRRRVPTSSARRPRKRTRRTPISTSSASSAWASTPRSWSRQHHRPHEEIRFGAGL